MTSSSGRRKRVSSSVNGGSNEILLNYQQPCSSRFDRLQKRHRDRMNRLRVMQVFFLVLILFGFLVVHTRFLTLLTDVREIDSSIQYSKTNATSVSGQVIMETSGATASKAKTTVPANSKPSHAATKQDSNTAVVLFSSWNPDNPSTENMETAIRSVFQYIVGLQETSPPLFVVLDNDDKNKEHVEEFRHSSRLVSIRKDLPCCRIHIAGSTEVSDSIRTLYPSVHYLYTAHEDLVFAAPVDHLGLVQTMENPTKKNVQQINAVLFSHQQTDATSLARTLCQKGNHRRLPIRRSTNYKAIEATLATDHLGVSDDSHLAGLCEACLYFPDTTNHFVRFDWYYQLRANQKTTNSSSSSNQASFSVDSLISEIQEGCKKREENGETTGLYLYFDDRLYFGSKVLRRVGE